MKPNVAFKLARRSWTAQAGLAFLVLGSASLVGGCEKSHSAAHLDVATPPQAAQGDSNDEWLNQQRLLHLKEIYSDNTVVDQDVNTSQLISVIKGECAGIYGSDTQDCSYRYSIDIKWSLCMARSAMAIATAQGDAITFQITPPSGASYTVVIDEVSEANASDMAAAASEYARSAIAAATKSLLTPPSNCLNTSGNWLTVPNTTPPRPWPLEFAANAVEAYYLGLGAMDRAVEAMVNFSDKARSSTPSPADGEARGILSLVSRAGAAHLLVGGEDGLLGSTTTGYCLAQSLTPQARAALKLLRDAAPPPNLLADPDINVLLNSNYTNPLWPTCTDCGGSVRQRLGKFYGLLSMQGAAGEPVEQHFDLQTKAFIQARDYLKQEASVFNRSQFARGPATPDATGYDRFGGTGGDRVSELPEGAWAARARFVSAQPIWYDGVVGIVKIDPHGWDPGDYMGGPGSTFRFAPLETLIAGSQIAFRNIMKSTNPFATGTTTQPASNPSSNEVKGLLGSVLQGADYRGGFEIFATASLLKVYAHGYTAADKVRVMVGEDGLRCALNNNIEGAPCTDSMTGAQYNCPPSNTTCWPSGGATNPAACVSNPSTFSCLTAEVLAVPSSPTGPYFGTDGYVGTSNGVSIKTSQLAKDKTRLYVVKLKDPNLLPNPEIPGNYELLGGTPLPITPTGTVANVDLFVPVVPSVNERVSKILAPNRKNCAVPSVNCMGKDYDARLPLEDELASDGDRVENSWKHYLDLARQAATESDMLGNVFREAKLNKLAGAALNEQRQEERRQQAMAALDDVQDICGTAIDSQALLSYFSGSDGSTNLDAVTIGPCTSGTCAVGAVCVAGMCLKDPANLTAATSPFKSDPDAQRLADCLGSGPASYEKYVTLGDTKLCVYSTVGHPGDICPAALKATTECPTIRPSTGCLAISGYDVAEARPLGYFTNEQPTTTLNACSAFRRARANHSPSLVTGTPPNTQPSSLADVMASEVFLPGRLSDSVGRLGFKAKFGGFFDITEGSAVRWSSGNIINGRTATAWPHAPIPECGLGTPQNGLFCKSWSATPTDTEIRDMNSRAFQAVWAAAGIRTFYDPTKKGLDVTFPSTGAWDTKGPTQTTISKDRTIPMWETKSALSNPSSRGSRTAYTWIQPSPVDALAWITPAATQIRTSTAAPNGPVAFFGPYDPNGEFHADFDPVSQINAGYAKTGETYREEAFGFLKGTWSEDHLTTFGVNARQTSVLYNLVAAKPDSLGTTWFSGGALLDGYELLCELDRMHSGANLKLTGPPTNLGDATQAAGYMRGLADQIRQAGALVTFSQVPVTAVNAIDQTGPSSGSLGLSGAMGQSVSDMKAAFIRVKETLPNISAQVEQMSAATDAFAAELDQAQATKDLNQLEYESTIFQAVSACAGGIINTIGACVHSDFGNIGSAASSCANMGWEFHAAAKKEELQDRISDDTAKISRATFREKMSQLALAMQEAALGLETTIEQINGALVAIDGLRKKANLALSKAMYLASYQAGQQQQNYDASVGSLADADQRRYIEALKNAKVMAFFARRAIEQRLGIDLTEMTEDLPLVAAPHGWEGIACSMSGIEPNPDNNASTGLSSDQGWVATYGEGFIGDYVDKLEKTVESYRLTQNFHEGQDVAVISLRDDVFDVRAKCKMPSRNLFKFSADLTNSEVWGAQSCNPVTVNSQPQPAMNCIQAVACDGACENFLPTPPMGVSKLPDLAVLGQRGAQAGAQGYQLRFGDGKTCAATTTPPVASPCGWKAGVAGAWPATASALSQVVNLAVGKYRLSWLTKDLATATFANAAKVGIVVVRGTTNAAGVTTPSPAAPANFVAPFSDTGAGLNWKRASAELTITVSGDYEVGFGVNQPVRPTEAEMVTIGGPMLETIPSNNTDQTFLGPFQATDGDDQTSFDDCEDKGGISFRRDNWNRQCTHLCSEGFSDNCTDGPEYCYQEFSFGIAQPWVASGKLFKYSGFARGNFNYRIDSLALNFVGSNTRDCTGSTLPSTCYNAGFIPYSIEHNGPFYIRNHDGADVQAMLFDGRIEHARGLALERYLTNPLSSTDRDLLTDYNRLEFAGRPLDGMFTVRLWEEPGVNLEGVEDVQLILNYRYWTAND